MRRMGRRSAAGSRRRIRSAPLSSATIRDMNPAPGRERSAAAPRRKIPTEVWSAMPLTLAIP
jgi:hypothetical protein